MTVGKFVILKSHSRPNQGQTFLWDYMVRVIQESVKRSMRYIQVIHICDISLVRKHKNDEARRTEYNFTKINYTFDFEKLF